MAHPWFLPASSADGGLVSASGIPNGISVLPEREQTILVLLAAARDLLIEAGRLNGDPDVSWHVSKVTKTERPPMTIDWSEYEG